jgi:hypothetical protein
VSEPLPEPLDAKALQAELADEPTSVNIARKGRRVLYVGITGRHLRRLHAHARASEWWRQASKIELRHLPTRGEAEEPERELIREWSPPFNVVHKIRPDEPPDADLERLLSIGFDERSAKVAMRSLPSPLTEADLRVFIDAHTYPPGTPRP